MSFNLDDYVDVAERERQFFERYPDGRIQVDLVDARNAQGEIVAWAAKASVWRTADDPLPVIDWAVEPVPGKTPYTRDSEAMNASTSAVGRAIVLAGFPTKKIASAQEVLARQAESAGDSSPPLPPKKSPAEELTHRAMEAQFSREHPNGAPEDDGRPENIVVTFGKHKDLRLGEIPQGYLQWLVDKYEPKNAEQNRIVAGARTLLGLDPFGGPTPDDDIPF